MKVDEVHVELARQANALREELNKAHVGHCSCDQCQQIDAELMAAPSLDEQIATLRGERDEARQQREIAQREVALWMAERKVFIRQLEQAEQQIATLTAERIQALGILNTQSRDGLLDACRQVKQVAISEADNSENLEAKLKALQGACEQLVEYWTRSLDDPDCDMNDPDDVTFFSGWNGAIERAIKDLAALLTAPPVPSETTK